MTRRLFSRLPWFLLSIHVLMTGAGFWLEERNGPDIGAYADANPVAIVLALIVLAATGALIASRQPGNPVGWLFMGLPLSLGLANLVSQYARYAVITRRGAIPGGLAAGWLGSFVWLAGPASLLFALMLFPDGRLPSRRWRWPAWAIVTALILVALGFALVPGPLSDSDFIENPFGVEALRGVAQVLVAGLAVLPILVVVSVASLIVKFRRSRGEERLRTKWFAYAAFVFAASMSVTTALSAYLPNRIGELVFALNIALLAAGVAIGILKHRLFDIDTIITKTFVYLSLVGFITGFYFLMVYSVGQAFSYRGDPSLAIAATAVIAIAIQPVRRWVQRLANRLVYGQRATPYEAMAEFSRQMAGALSIEVVLPRMAETAAKGIGAVRSRVRIFLPNGGELSACWPKEAIDERFDRAVEVAHHDHPVGEIAVTKAPGDPISVAEEKLLEDLALQAGPVLSNVRLFEELKASRERIVKAQDEERRRMERDIHDGAQQQLVSMSVKLGLAKALLSKDPAKAEQMLDQLKQEASDAVETLRDLARGLFPQTLVERGIVAALDSHVTKTDLPVTIEGTVERMDPELEANVYFCIREALQNASKHAPGVPIIITIGSTDSELRFTVSDQGPGFDTTTAKLGAGLQNMRDRIEALGGTLRINSRPGEGTQLVGAIPARSQPVPV